MANADWPMFRGDAALIDYTERFDGCAVQPSDLRFSQETLTNIASGVDADVLDALREVLSASELEPVGGARANQSRSYSGGSRDWSRNGHERFQVLCQSRFEPSGE